VTNGESKPNRFLNIGTFNLTTLTEIVVYGNLKDERAPLFLALSLSPLRQYPIPNDQR
jgi:hypothetical protein